MTSALCGRPFVQAVTQEIYQSHELHAEVRAFPFAPLHLSLQDHVWSVIACAGVHGLMRSRRRRHCTLFWHATDTHFSPHIHFMLQHWLWSHVAVIKWEKKKQKRTFCLFLESTLHCWSLMIPGDRKRERDMCKTDTVSTHVTLMQLGNIMSLPTWISLRSCREVLLGSCFSWERERERRKEVRCQCQRSIT